VLEHIDGGTSVFLRGFLLIAVAGALAAHSRAVESQSTPGVSATQIKIGQTIAYSGPASSFATIGRTQAAITGWWPARVRPDKTIRSGG
jgi:hypothetical protein